MLIDEVSGAQVDRVFAVHAALCLSSEHFFLDCPLSRRPGIAYVLDICIQNTLHPSHVHVPSIRVNGTGKVSDQFYDVIPTGCLTSCDAEVSGIHCLHVRKDLPDLLCCGVIFIEYFFMVGVYVIDIVLDAELSEPALYGQSGISKPVFYPVPCTVCRHFVNIL